MKMARNQEDRANGTSMASLARYLGLAAALPMGAAAGYVIGGYLDSTLHTQFLRTACVVVFVIGGFIQLVRELLRDVKAGDAGKS
jgi:F0F1-type ATP synthase assembly protein I